VTACRKRWPETEHLSAIDASPVGKFRLKFRVGISTVMFLMFFTFTVAPLLGILIYGYRQNEASALRSLEHQVSRNMNEAVVASAEMIETVGRTIAIVAEAGAHNPWHFKTERGNELLWRALTAGDHIDAVYVSQEDGYHRVVTRIDDDRRKSDRRIPANATWHASYVDEFSKGDQRARHRQFFSIWGGESSGDYSTPTDLDIRKLPHYIGAKRDRRLSIGKPSVNPDTGYPVVSMGYPIVTRGRFIGFVGANMTLSNISRFLHQNLISPNSTTIIYDEDGQLIASSDFSLLKDPNRSLFDGSTDNIKNPAIREALDQRRFARLKLHLFDDSAGRQYSIMELPFPSRFEKDWWVMTVAPTDDFIGELIETNRRLAIITGIIILVITIITIIVAAKIRRLIRYLVSEFDNIGQFTLTDGQRVSSFIDEVRILDQSKEKMKTSLRSFGRYVPTDLVRKLIVSGEEAELGGERRKMTIFFSDIADFTSISEQMDPEAIVEELGDYFELMRESLNAYQGTLDKYMGDGILALFNAPQEVPDHETAACLAALDAQRRLAADRGARESAGRPQFHARIGLDVGEVLVGNIGTSDRFSYTVIGDPVNLSSRLEGLCKFYGASIMGSEELKDATGDRFEWCFLDCVAVVGRSNSTRIHQLIGEKGAVSADILTARDRYEEAIALYMAADFAEASKLFAALARDWPDQTAAAIMARRARKLHRTPPEGDWTGVYVHTKK